jgi:small subunit ribosomal protein S17
VQERSRKAAERSRWRKKRRAKHAAGERAAPAEQPSAAREPGTRKVRQGVVVSSKGEKTITVRIDVVKRHKRYHKILRSTVKLHAHDERNDAHEGDTVRVVECRPMSRSKRWRLDEVLERAK